MKAFQNFKEISNKKEKWEKQRAWLKDYEGLIENYKNQLENRFNIINSNLNLEFDSKMKELNYPFCIGECNQCHQGYMAKHRTKTGKEVYSCSNWRAGCKHSIWLN